MDFDTAAFACWKKLRAMFVAADKKRHGHLPLQTVTAILLRNHVGSGPDEVDAKTQAHTTNGGVNYNSFIKSVLQARSK